jgi:cytochrome P450
MEMDWPIFMTGMNETWRKGRKLLYRGLRPGAIISYRQMMQEKTRELIAQLRANPKDFYTHVEESVDHFPYIVWPLMAGQTSGKDYNVTHVWL